MIMGGNKHYETISRIIERSATITDLGPLSKLVCEEAAGISVNIALAAIISTENLGNATEVLSDVGDRSLIEYLTKDLLRSIPKTSLALPSDLPFSKTIDSPTSIKQRHNKTKQRVKKGNITLHLPIRSNGLVQAYLSIISHHGTDMESEEIELLESLAHITSLIWTTIVVSSPPRVALGSSFDREMLEVLDQSGIALAVIDKSGTVVFANDRAHNLVEGSAAHRLEDILPRELVERLGPTSSLIRPTSSGHHLATLGVIKLWQEDEKVRSLRYSLRTVLSSEAGAQEPQLVVMVVDTSALTHLQHQIEHISELILTGTQAAPIAITIPHINDGHHIGSLASEIDLTRLYEEVFQRYSATSLTNASDHIEIDNLSIAQQQRQLSLWITFAASKSPAVKRGVVLDTTEEMTATRTLRRSIKVSDLQVRFAESCAKADSIGELDAALSQLILGLGLDIHLTQVALNDHGQVKDMTTNELLPTDNFVLNILSRALRNLSVEVIPEVPPFSFRGTATGLKENASAERLAVVIPRSPAAQIPPGQSRFYYITYPATSTDLHDHMLQVGNLYINTLRRLALAPARARLGQTDPTTGLRVTRALYDVIEQVQTKIPRVENESWLLVVKLEESDQIQGHFGFDIHEELLRSLAKTQAAASGGHEVFRVGQSTLVSWVVGINKTHAKRVILALEQLNRKPFEVSGILFALNFQSSITRCEVGLTPKDNLSRALEDNLVARTSRSSKEHKSTIHNKMARLAEVKRIVSVLENDRFDLYVQPKWSLALDSPVSFEALLRWPEGDPPPIPTQRVISIVESLNLINELTSNVIRRALPILKQIREFNPTLTLAVNISPTTLQSSKWLTEQQKQLKGNVPLQGIIFEITESVAFQNSQKVFYAMKEFANLGTLYSIDDFGTGFTSLQNLTRLPLSELKIDISFIRSVTVSKRSRSLVKAQIDIAHSLGISAVAEGVEDFEQLEVVRDLGCDIVQGYLIARPFPASRVVQWLESTAHITLRRKPEATEKD